MTSWMLHLWCLLTAVTAALLCNSYLMDSMLQMSRVSHDIAH